MHRGESGPKSSAKDPLDKYGVPRISQGIKMPAFLRAEQNFLSGLAFAFGTIGFTGRPLL